MHGSTVIELFVGEALKRGYCVRPLMELRIIPVAHISKKSVRNVRKAIEEERPDVVAIELDRARLGSLLEKKEPSARDLLSQPLAAMIYLFQKAVGKWLKIMPGSEMLAAVEAAQMGKIPVALIDQDISITMGRLARIPLGEKLSLVSQVLISPIAFIPNPFSRKKPLDFDELAAGNNLEVFFAEFKKHLPHTYRVLVEERDEHMFQQLRSLRAGKVVAVMGAGHAQGIARKIREGGGAKLAGKFRFSLSPPQPSFAS